MTLPQPRSTLFPYTTLFRSQQSRISKVAKCRTKILVNNNLRTVSATIALTGYGQEQHRQAALEAGFDQHFIKPMDFEKLDRKSTRLNSSHVKISYAVFCLKK